jgi:hypothetical protein
MRQETLAETLRAWAEACKVFEDAATRRRETHDAVPEEYRYADRAEDYLRGYDDAKAEAAHTEMLLREAQDELANANARLRELAAELAVRMTVPEAQPAAVGVVGAVRWGRMDALDCMADGTCDSIESAKRLAAASHYNRVVALVDPDAIVPLASGTAARWRHDQLDRVWHHRDLAACAGYGTVSPLYPGLAQPAQERDA